MKNSKDLKKDTDYNKMIAHLTNPKPIVAEVLAQIPEIYSLSFPEGHVDMQMEGILNFVVRNFKTISANEILEAFELNAAHKFLHYIDSYNRFTVDYVGKILHAYLRWRADNKPKPEMQEDELNIERELVRDIENIHTSENYDITRYVDEKWNWLVANRPDFDHTIDESELEELKEYYRKKDSIIPKHFMKPDLLAMNKYMSKKIHAYLSELKKVK